MVRSEEFRHPITYEGIRPEIFDTMLLPSGHAPGMRPYLESDRLLGKAPVAIGLHEWRLQA